jgi:hypothetical protein
MEFIAGALSELGSRPLGHEFGNINVPLSRHGGLVGPKCTKKPESYALTSKPGNYALRAFRSDYQTWNCQQLADESDLLKDALAVASEQRAGNTTEHLKAEAKAVQTARTLKKCSA